MRPRACTVDVLPYNQDQATPNTLNKLFDVLLLLSSQSKQSFLNLYIQSTLHSNTKENSGGILC